MSKNKRRRQGRPRPANTPQSESATTPNRAPGSVGPPRPAETGPERHGHIETAQIKALIELIAAGALDGHLDAIETAIARRQRDHHRAATHQAATGLQIGDRVRLTGDIRPLYLKGATGTITGWAHTNAVVELDNPTGRFTQGRIRCPPLGLQRLPG